MNPDKKKNSLTAFLWLLGVCCLVYGNALFSNEFVWDDEPIIVNNELLRDASTLPHLLTMGYWQTSSGSGTVAHEYRPCLMLSYFLNERVFGLHPVGYRLVNIILHALNALLILLLLQQYYPAPTARLAALLFAVLPVHSESVASITGRSELLCFLWMMLAWLLLARHRRLTASSAAFFLLALFTKEHAVIFPFIWILADWTFYPNSQGPSNRWRTLGGLLGLVGLYLGIRLMVLGPRFQGGRDYFAGQPYLIRLLTMARFTASYTLGSLTTGWRSYVSYSRPLVRDALRTDVLAWVWVIVAAASVGGAARGLRRKSKTAFWILFGFLFFLPTSNLVVPLDSLGASRFLYTSSLAYCLLLSQAIGLIRSPRWRKTTAVLLSLAYAAFAVAQNPQWSYSAVMAQSMKRHNPGSARGWISLAVYHLRRGDWPACAEALETARRLDPENPDVFYNAGCLYERTDQWKKAREAFMTATALSPQGADAWLHLGLLAEREKKTQLALDYYRQVLRIRPGDSTAHYNTARLLLANNQIEAAVWHYRYFLKMAPRAAEAPIARQVLALIYKDFPQLR